MEDVKPYPGPWGARVKVTDTMITVDLRDGRIIAIPLAWSRKLTNATQEQRDNWRPIGDGIGFHWPDVDEDISVRSMMAWGQTTVDINM